MKLTVVGSGSAGNCYLLHSTTEVLVIEAGIRPDAHLYQCFASDFSRVAAVLVSHHHADHAAYARLWMEAGCTVRTLPDVIKQRALSSPVVKPFAFGQWFREGGFSVLPFPLIHYDPDGTPCPTAGFLIDHPDTGRILFATDCNSLSREEPSMDGIQYVPYRFASLRHIMIEANYDDYILHLSDLPHSQKERIRRSHMSVTNAVSTLRSLDLSQCRDIMLLHLSERNQVNNESKIIRRIRLATGVRCFIARAGLSVDF